MHLLLSRKPNASEANVRQALLRLVAALLDTPVAVLLFIRRDIQGATLPLPKQISRYTIYFEDAFGDCKPFELGLIVDWEGFYYVLNRVFRNRPGSGRVANFEYRLCDRRRAVELIDPRHPPAFPAIFRSGCYIRMSINFDWSEAPDDRCPRFGLEQDLGPDRKTICMNRSCNFRYRLAAPPTANFTPILRSLGHDTANSHTSTYEHPWYTGLSQDAPSKFSSIIIFKQVAIRPSQCSLCPK